MLCRLGELGMDSFWKIVYRFLFFILIAGGICWIVLGFWITSEPLQPNPETGHVIEFNEHGAIHYITAIEHHLFFGLLPFEALVIGALAGMKWWLRNDYLGKGPEDLTL